MKKLFFMGLVVLTSSVILMSCEKKEVEMETPLKSQQASNSYQKTEINLDSLRLFFADATGVPADSISYNVDEDAFMWRGQIQITKTNLIEAYNQNK